MDAVHAPILARLRELELVAAQRGDVVSILRELDRLTAALPKATDPDLLHYLHKRSYEKARLFLEGVDPEAGACPR